jgi:hypothetical protein
MQVDAQAARICLLKKLSSDKYQTHRTLRGNERHTDVQRSYCDIGVTVLINVLGKTQLKGVDSIFRLMKQFISTGSSTK